MKTGSEQKTDMNKTTKIIRGSVLLILGIFQNGPADIRNKAVRICYECIGIG